MPVRRVYSLSLPAGRYVALRASEVRSGERPMPSASASSLLERAIVRPAQPGELAALHDAITGSAMRRHGEVSRMALTNAFQSGAWVLLPAAAPAPNYRPSGAAESPGEQVKSARVVKTWVEMEVVDDDGRPMAGRGYVCMLPDGTLQTGTLDRGGRVRFEGIDPGNCAFSLTDFHAADWDWAA